jgi:glyoxylase-like metal-dependent hydrolase (beta-lactamase superfamily II)
MLTSTSRPRDKSMLRESTEIADGVFQISLSIVNAYLIGPPGARSGKWVLVDTGLYTSAGKIIRAAEELYGAGSRPGAIILTHGHFDHVGSVMDLAAEWDVPVYAHYLELPYLDGRSSYPPPDPTVGGGAMALMSPLYPRGPIEIGRRLRILPSRGSVPVLSGWEYIHTPGHTPGHISLFRDSDGVLIAGDAFVTTRQESFFGALLHPLELNGPPKYFTPDWESAWNSVITLASLHPDVAATGHGKPMYGVHLRYELTHLAEYFYQMAVPDFGRYVDKPALADEDGVFAIPHAAINPTQVAVGLLAVGILGAALTAKLVKR